MRHTVRHELERERARDVLDHALETYRQHYADHDVETAWLDDSTAEIGFNMTGRRIRGTIEVREDRFEIDLDLPWILLPFQSRIFGAVDDELERWLARA